MIGQTFSHFRVVEMLGVRQRGLFGSAHRLSSVVMTNGNWWDRAKLPPGPQPIDIRKCERLCPLRKEQR